MKKQVVIEAKTVDAAITEGARELGVDPSDVEYFVEYAGNPGILGIIGRKPARVRVALEGHLTVAEEPERPKAKPARQEQPAARDSDRGPGRGDRNRNRKPGDRPRDGQQDRRAPQEARREAPAKGRPQPERQPNRQTERQPERQPNRQAERQPERQAERQSADISATAAERHSEPQRRPEREFVGEKGEHSEVVEKTLREVAGLFALDVSIEALQNDERVVARVSGDAGSLIGRRGKTVAALQYMVSRILNEDRQDRRRVFIDVDGYRSDREDLLKDRAEEAFDLCVREDRWVAMECMPSQDRRFIHMLAQKEETIRTESVGREGYRRVVVFPAGMEVDLEHVEQELERKNSGRRDDRRQGGRGRRGGGGGGGDRRRSRPRN